MIGNESDILNGGGLKGAVSAPSGYGAALRSKKYVSKWTHGFKHIIHIRH